MNKIAMMSFGEYLKQRFPKSAFVLKHHRPILGGIAGLYILNKLAPDSLYDYFKKEKQSEDMDKQIDLLKSISSNTAKPEPSNRDTYLYGY